QARRLHPPSRPVGRSAGRSVLESVVWRGLRPAGSPAPGARCGSQESEGPAQTRLGGERQVIARNRGRKAPLAVRLATGIGIVAPGVPRSLGGVTKFTFFYLKKVTVGGKSISLYDLENDVIRPLGEERVHFALNCMAVSCPRLPRTAFTADALEQQLDTATR